MTDKESQENELSALESIFNSEELRIITDNGIPGGQFYAHPDVSPDFKIVYRDLRKEETDVTEVKVKYLPPLVLYFSLPSDYPSTNEPNFSLSCKWLRKTEILRLCRKLDELWEENRGMEILFLWTQFLKEESLKFLGCEKILDLSVIYTSHLKFLAHKKTESLQNVATVSCSKQNVNRGAIHKPVPSSSNENREKKFSDNDSGKRVNQNYPENRFSQKDSEKRFSQNDSEKRFGQNDSEKRFSQNDSEKRFSQNDSEKRFSQYNSEKRFSQYNSGKRYSQNDWEKRFKHHSYNRNYSGRGNRGSRRGSRAGWRYQRNWSDRHEHSHSSPPDTSIAVQNDNSEIKENERESKEPEESIEESTKAANQGTPLDYTSNLLDASEQDIDEDARAVLDISPLMSVVRVLTEYNKAREEEIFKRNFYTCKICYQDKLGAQSTKFEPCEHVFCRDCISSYLEVRIKDGTVHHITCPEDKCTSEATAIQVQGLVSQDLFEKYDSVLLTAMIDSMEDVIYCPRSFCQYPTTGNPSEKMATCPACNYVFCIYCKMVYHGVEPCRLKTGKRQHLVNEYLSADAKHKEELEQRYGKKQIQLLVDNTMSEMWISNNSKNCPHCNAAIEKSDGCNKMTCWKCSTYFCWICSARLNPQSPYAHFSDRTSNCFNMLFHNMNIIDPEGDDDDNEENEVVGAYIGLGA